MRKLYVKAIFVILIIFSILLSSLCFISFSKTKVIDSTYVRLKVTQLVIRSKVDNFWQGQMYTDRDKIKNMPQEDRVEYFVAVLYALPDKLQKSGEATLIYYEVIPHGDKTVLYEKLDELEATKDFRGLKDFEKSYIVGIKQTIKLSSMTKQEG